MAQRTNCRPGEERNQYPKAHAAQYSEMAEKPKKPG